MVETSPPRHGNLRRDGFTLLEVVIALAIFAFGALAIIGIFPPGLGVIQNSGDQLTAVNFNQGALAQYAKNPGLIPDATYDLAGDQGPTAWNQRVENAASIPGSVLGTRRNNSLPNQNFLDYAGSALGHFKQISAERHLVPQSGVILTQFPYDTSIAAPLLYSEDKLDGVNLNSNGTLDLTKATTDSNSTAYSFTANDVLYVSYRWIDSAANQVWATRDEPINSSTAVVFEKNNPATSQVITGPVDVRLRRPISSPSISATDAALGRMSLGTTYAGQTLSVDYRVRDWRWMVEDGTPNIIPDGAATNEKDVYLPVRPLDDTTSPFFYTLFKTAKAGTTPNLNTTDSSTRADADDVRKTGRVSFTASGTLIGDDAPTSRVVYRTADNWTRQVSVAARSYKLVYDGTAQTSPAEEWRDCILVGSSSTSKILYFKPSEAGKTIRLSYSYPGVSAGSEVRVDGKILSVDDDIISAPAWVPAGFTVNGYVSQLQLKSADGVDISPTSIREIDGVGVQSRTAWLNGDRYTQVSTVGFRGAND